MNCSAADYRALLDTRLVPFEKTYSQWYQDDIVWDLMVQLEQNFWGGQLGITRDQQADRVLRNETFDRMSKLGSDCIDRFADMEDGFDYWIDVDPADFHPVFRTRTWRGDWKPDFPIALGATAESVQRTWDSQAYGNDVFVYGAPMPKPPEWDPEDPATWQDHDGTFWTNQQPPTGQGRYWYDARWVWPEGWNKQDQMLYIWTGNNPQLPGSVPNRWEQVEEMPEPWAERWAANMTEQRAGRIMRTFSNSDLKSQESVNAAADKFLAESLRPPATYSCELRDGIWLRPADCWLGDRVPVFVRSGPRLNTKTTARVATLDISIDEDNAEKVTLGLDQADPEEAL